MIDYEKMEAGEALDALVAERVMGWRDVGKEANSQHHEFVIHGVDPNTVAERRERKMSARQRIPPYSKSIEAAWSVVEKLRADGWSIFIQSESDGCSIEATRDISEELGGGCIVGDETAPTFPLVVCRVALYVTDCVAALLATAEK